MKICYALSLLSLISACASRQQPNTSTNNAVKEKPKVYGFQIVPKTARSHSMVLKMPADSLNGPVKMPNSGQSSKLKPVPMPTLKPAADSLK